MDWKTVLRRHRSVLSAVGFVAAVALILWVVNTPMLVGVAASKRDLPVYCVQRDDKVIAISFDAAWGNEDTQTLIDILDERGVHATFFVVGDWVDRYPDSVRAIAEAGNEVMSHSLHHAHFSKLSSEEIKNDLLGNNEKIRAVTGVSPVLFRCPYGEYDDHVIQAVRDVGMTAIQWDVDSLDWKGISAQEIRDRVLKNVRPGSIVLFHNAAEHTPEALPDILDSLMKDGYTIVPVSELLLDGETTIDHTGRQRAA